jgi:hypothetical protein
VIWDVFACLGKHGGIRAALIQARNPHTNFQPSEANFRQICLPMPSLPPVTRTVLPLSFIPLILFGPDRIRDTMSGICEKRGYQEVLEPQLFYVSDLAALGIQKNTGGGFEFAGLFGV